MESSILTPYVFCLTYQKRRVQKKGRIERVTLRLHYGHYLSTYLRCIIERAIIARAVES